MVFFYLFPAVGDVVGADDVIGEVETDEVMVCVVT